MALLNLRLDIVIRGGGMKENTKKLFNLLCQELRDFVEDSLDSMPPNIRSWSKLYESRIQNDE